MDLYGGCAFVSVYVQWGCVYSIKMHISLYGTITHHFPYSPYTFKFNLIIKYNTDYKMFMEKIVNLSSPCLQFQTETRTSTTTFPFPHEIEHQLRGFLFISQFFRLSISSSADMSPHYRFYTSRSTKHQ